MLIGVTLLEHRSVRLCHSVCSGTLATWACLLPRAGAQPGPGASQPLHLLRRRAWLAVDGLWLGSHNRAGRPHPTLCGRAQWGRATAPGAGWELPLAGPEESPGRWQGGAQVGTRRRRVAPTLKALLPASLWSPARCFCGDVWGGVHLIGSSQCRPLLSLSFCPRRAP